jgi:hypothetical protein
MERTLERTRAELRAMRDAPHLLGQLDRMTVDQLAAKYLELYGEPTRSRNGERSRGQGPQEGTAWRAAQLLPSGRGVICRRSVICTLRVQKFVPCVYGAGHSAGQAARGELPHGYAYRAQCG